MPESTMKSDPLAVLETPDPAWDLLRLNPSRAAAIPELWSGNVVVVGGGSAGCAAAGAAARHGRRTLLVEAGGFFGGTAVGVLDTMYGFFPAGSHERIVGGIGWEVAGALLASDQAILRGNTYGAGTGVTYEPEALKTEWDRRLSSSRGPAAPALPRGGRRHGRCRSRGGHRLDETRSVSRDSTSVR